MTLTFNAFNHAYHLDGKSVPSVTTIIRAVIAGWSASEWHMQRGTAVHRACELLDQGLLDRATVFPEIESRVKAWEKFRADYPGIVETMETPLGSERYRFAGTPDRVFLEKNHHVIVDLKSSIEPQVKLQLGGYSLLWAENRGDGRKIAKAGAVELRENGTYSVLWLSAHQLRRAEQQFLALLTVYNFMNDNDLLM